MPLRQAVSPSDQRLSLPQFGKPLAGVLLCIKVLCSQGAGRCHFSSGPAGGSEVSENPPQLPGSALKMLVWLWHQGWCAGLLEQRRGTARWEGAARSWCLLPLGRKRRAGSQLAERCADGLGTPHPAGKRAGLEKFFIFLQFVLGSAGAHWHDAALRFHPGLAC